MNYILMHKKIAVAELNISEKRARISAIGEVFDYIHRPKARSSVYKPPF